MNALSASSGDFHAIAQLIRERRTHALQTVNQELVSLYWEIGKILHAKIQSNGWGKKTIDDLAVYLKSKHSDLKGFSRRRLYRIRQFHETYPGEIVPTLLTQLSWSHHLLIFSQCKCSEEREFYQQATLKEQWSFRELQRQLHHPYDIPFITI